MDDRCNQLRINADQLPIVIYFCTKDGIIKEYVLKTNQGNNNNPPQSILVLNKRGEEQ
jgi:hypothetical protein